MKELIEKIKKEIKKEIESYMDLQCDFEDHEMSCQEEILDNHYEGCKSGLKKAIDIINEEAKAYNNGWIPCSERLPKYAGDYLVTQYNPKATDEYCNGSRISTIFFDNNGWWDDIDFSCGWEVIAWQPLPPAFKPKGE